MPRELPRDLAVVSLDCDGTLIHPAIFNAVADELGFGAPLQWSYAEYAAGRMTIPEAWAHDYPHFVGRKVADLHAALERTGAWTPGIPEAIAALKAAGLRVVVTTDQPRFLVEFARRFGVDDLVCTEAEVRDGVVSGPHVPRFEKWPNLREWLARAEVDPRRVAHVGNGSNDVPVWREVGYALAVNAERPEVAAAADESIPRLADFRDVAERLLRRG